MASSGGTSSGSAIDERKQKRMQSNRESARRSRMRKKKLMEDMVAQLGRLREDKCRTAAAVNLTSQMCMETEAKNCVLRAQMRELSHRLESLNEIIGCVTSINANAHQIGYGEELLVIPWPITDTFMS